MGDLSVPTVNFPTTMTRPRETICIDHDPGTDRITGHDDAGGLVQGNCVYRTAGTQKNDFTLATDEHGSASANSILYGVEMDFDSVHQSYNWADEAYSANDPIKVVRYRQGKKYWAKVVALNIVEGTMYTVDAGFIVAIDDPTPDAVVYNAHCFTALAFGTTITGWVPFIYEGLVAIDST